MIKGSLVTLSTLLSLFAVTLGIVSVASAQEEQGVQSLVVERSEDRLSAAASWDRGGVEHQIFSVVEKVRAGESDPDGDGVKNDSFRLVGGLLSGDVASLEITDLDPTRNYRYTVHGAIADGAGGWTLSVDAVEDELSAVEMDREALAALYDATDGANWRESANWLSDAPLDEWHGVKTDSDGRVVEVDLWLNKMVGQIPAELGNLAKLERLNLMLNGLNGAIPSELGTLSDLEELTLLGNKLTGEIPSELGDLANLEKLYLSVGNQYTGCIPAALENVATNDLSELGLPFCS